MDSLYKDKTINSLVFVMEIFIPGKTVLYWDGAQIPKCHMASLGLSEFIMILRSIADHIMLPCGTMSFWWLTHEIDGLVQERRNSIASALELRFSCTNTSKCSLMCWSIVTLFANCPFSVYTVCPVGQCLCYTCNYFSFMQCYCL